LKSRFFSACESDDDDEDEDDEWRHFSILSIFHLSTSRWCFCASRRRLSERIVNGCIGSGSEADSLVTQSSGAHDEPSPAQTSHTSYVLVPSTRPLQSLHDVPSPLHTSHTS